MQKEANSLPAYAASDIVGKWSGCEFAVYANFELVEIYSSSVTVSENFSLSGSNKYGTILEWGPTYGAFYAERTSPADWVTIVILSLSKHFAGGLTVSRGQSGLYPVRESRRLRSAADPIME